MYIVKNALRCISRSKGRNILIGIIALVIAVSACLGLSIRQAAETAKEDLLDGLTVTASISYDRQSVMNNIGGMAKPDSDSGEGEKGSFDKSQFAEMMTGASSLTLEEYETYAEADSVKDFYYTLTASFNGSDTLEPVTTDSDSNEDTDDSDSDAEDDADENISSIGGSANGDMGQGMGGNMSGNMGGGRGGMTDMFGGTISSGDFTLVGYSSEAAMTDFQSGAASITDGTVFEEGVADNTCIITEELALYNDLEVGDVLTITNPSDEEETYELTISGIYTSSDTNDTSFSMFSVSQDPANKIYTSVATLQGILDASEEVSETLTDETTGMEYESAVTGTLSATYVFATTDDYYAFEEEVRELGLEDSYTVSSTDLTSYESSLTPLNTLSTMAGYFLIVILIIGAIILIVLNIFNVRERKYEIGVLTAMGMKKGKVALQFMTEILVVTMAAIIIGACIGAVSSVPVTNALLASQVESQSSQENQIEANFGRGEMPDGMGSGDMSAMDIPTGDMAGGNKGGGSLPSGMTDMIGSIFGENAANYITEVDSAMNFTVVLQMLGIGILLTLVASAVSVLFVMRYDPLKILANRD